VTVEMFPDVHWEVKRCERVSIDRWCDQAANAARGLTPIVAWRRNRQPWRVAMLLDDYLDLRARLHLAEGGQ
jgi:hypothetical protein